MAFFPNSGGGFFSQELSPLEQFLRAQGFVQQRGGVPPSPATSAQLGYNNPGPNFFPGQQIGGVGQVPFQSLLGLFEGARQIAPDSTTAALSTGITGPTFSGAQQGVGTVAQPGQTPSNTGMPGSQPALDQNLGLLGYGAFGGAFSGGAGSGAGAGSGGGTSSSLSGAISGVNDAKTASSLLFGSGHQQSQQQSVGDTGGTSLSDQVRSNQQQPVTLPSSAAPDFQQTFSSLYGPGFAQSVGNVSPTNYFNQLTGAGLTPSQANDVMMLQTEAPESRFLPANVGAIGAPGPGGEITGIQQQMLSPTTGATNIPGAIQGGLGGLGGVLNLIQGIQGGNPLGAAGGALSTVQALNQLLQSSPQLAQSLGLTNILGSVSPALSGIGGAAAPILSVLGGLFGPNPGSQNPAEQQAASNEALMSMLGSTLSAAGGGINAGASALSSLLGGAGAGAAGGAEAAGAGGAGAAGAAGGAGEAAGAAASALAAPLAVLPVVVGIAMAIDQALNPTTDYSINKLSGQIGPGVTASLQNTANLAQLANPNLGQLDIPTLESLVSQYGNSLLGAYNPVGEGLNGSNESALDRFMSANPGQAQANIQGTTTGLLDAIGQLQKMGVSNADIGNLLGPDVVPAIGGMKAGDYWQNLPTSYWGPYAGQDLQSVFGSGSYGANVNSPWFMSQVTGGPLWYELQRLGYFDPQYAPALQQAGVTLPGANLPYLQAQAQNPANFLAPPTGAVEPDWTSFANFSGA